MLKVDGVYPAVETIGSGEYKIARPLQMITRDEPGKKEQAFINYVLSEEGLKVVEEIGFKIITPGIRPDGAKLGDQRRVMTPAEAVRAGASYIVIGRPIAGAPDPAAAAKAILEQISGVADNG